MWRWPRIVVGVGICVLAMAGCSARGGGDSARPAAKASLHSVQTTSDRLARSYLRQGAPAAHELLAEDIEVVLPMGDSIRGKAAVMSTGALGAGLGGTDKLVRGELWFCVGGPQEYGYFEIGHPESRTTVTGGYQLFWREEGGAWKISRVALTLPKHYASVRQRSCRGAQEVVFSSKRWSVGLYPGWTSRVLQSPGASVLEAVRSAGWGDTIRYYEDTFHHKNVEKVHLRQYFPRERKGAGSAPAVAVAYTFSDRLSAQVFGIGRIEGSVEGFDSEMGKASLAYSVQSVSASVGYRVSVLRLEAGVLLSKSEWGWRPDVSWRAEPLEWSARGIGYHLGSTLTLPVSSHFAVEASLQHRGVPAPDVRPYRGLGSAPVRLDHTQALLGISIRR